MAGYLFMYPPLKDGELLDNTYFWGGRSSCKKNFLVEHGNFNPVFKFGCEDIELGYPQQQEQQQAAIYGSKPEEVQQAGTKQQETGRTEGT